MELRPRLSELLDGAEVRELAGGDQSRVFETTGEPGGRPRIVKVVDASLVDRDTHAIRTELVAALAAIDPHVCRPLRIDGRLVTELGLGDGRRGLVTCSEHAGGRPVDVGRPDDARLMGETLAALHRSLRSIGRTDLPPAAALRVVGIGGGSRQLLHGDFSASNLRERDGMLRVFDFDDCGYGPSAFDVANALYMVRFDDMTGTAPTFYRAFAAAFLAGYEAISGDACDEDELAYLIRRRVAALDAWLDDPPSAPAGIRTASPEWHRTLRTFVTQHRARFGR